MVKNEICKLWYVCRNASSECGFINSRKCNIYNEFRKFIEKIIMDCIQYNDMEGGGF